MEGKRKPMDNKEIAESKVTPAQTKERAVGTDVRVRAVGQLVIAVGIIGVMLFLYVAERQVAVELVALSSGIVGWYFRGVMVSANGETKP